MRRAIGRLAIGIALCALAETAPARALEATEPAIKAAFLYKFGFFVEWPQASFASGDSPINLCIVGDDTFGALLDDTVKGKKIGNRTVAVRRMDAVTKNSGCHILYVGGSEAQPVAEALAAVRGTPVLTVTDESHDSGAKGIINLIVQDNRVRFEIDDQAAAENGLLISSKLLSLAAHVRPRL